MQVVMTNDKNHAFYIIDNLGNIINWTSSAEEIYGYPAGYIVGKHISFFYTEGDIKKNELQNLEDKVQKTGEYLIRGWRQASSGQLLLAEEAFTLLYAGDNKPGGFLVETKNISKDSAEEFYDEIESTELKENLSAIAAYRLSLREEENTAMARKIHDELGQQITGLKMDVSWLEKKLHQEDESIKKRIKIIVGMLDDTVKMVRRISSDLRPGILDDFGLIDAAEWYSGEFEKKSGIKVIFRADEEDIGFDKNNTTQLFRIYQESLNSTLDYKGTSIITSSIHVRGKFIEWTISCDGKENKEKENERGKLMIMDIRERLFRIGGSYKIKVIPEEGTTAYISIPIKKL